MSYQIQSKVWQITFLQDSYDTRDFIFPQNENEYEKYQKYLQVTQEMSILDEFIESVLKFIQKRQSRYIKNASKWQCVSILLSDIIMLEKQYIKVLDYEIFINAKHNGGTRTPLDLEIISSTSVVNIASWFELYLCGFHTPSTDYDRIFKQMQRDRYNYTLETMLRCVCP